MNIPNSCLVGIDKHASTDDSVINRSSSGIAGAGKLKRLCVPGEDIPTLSLM